MKASLKLELFFHIQAIRHEELNSASDPCDPTTEYNFQNCIFEKLTSEIGCLPHWLTDLKTKFPSCSMAYQLKNFFDKSKEVMLLNEKKFHERFNCYKPCKYYEYKVRDKNETK